MAFLCTINTPFLVSLFFLFSFSFAFIVEFIIVLFSIAYTSSNLRFLQSRLIRHPLRWTRRTNAQRGYRRTTCSLAKK